jgi:hypothetical protein
VAEIHPFHRRFERHVGIDDLVSRLEADGFLVYFSANDARATDTSRNGNVSNDI